MQPCFIFIFFSLLVGSSLCSLNGQTLNQSTVSVSSESEDIVTISDQPSEAQITL